jgi:hypothetical protein
MPSFPQRRWMAINHYGSLPIRSCGNTLICVTLYTADVQVPNQAIPQKLDAIGISVGEHAKGGGWRGNGTRKRNTTHIHGARTTQSRGLRLSHPSLALMAND